MAQDTRGKSLLNLRGSRFKPRRPAAAVNRRRDQLSREGGEGNPAPATRKPKARPCAGLFCARQLLIEGPLYPRERTLVDFSLALVQFRYFSELTEYLVPAINRGDIR
jgi:hypothetical protein